jgi:hypothetical protein
MKHRVDGLDGALLDAAVAKAGNVVIDPEWIDASTFEDLSKGERRLVLGGPGTPNLYSTDWQYGGPLIERERISVEPIEAGRWVGRQYDPLSTDDGGHDHPTQEGPTPLIAAMRAFVASKFGEEVDLG